MSDTTPPPAPALLSETPAPVPKRRPSLLAGLACQMPLLVLTGIILVVSAAAFAAAGQEMPARWLQLHQGQSATLTYTLLMVHTVLTPGLGLLVYIVPRLIRGSNRLRCRTGAWLLAYYPVRLAVLFITLGFTPVWLLLELAELVFFSWRGWRVLRQPREAVATEAVATETAATDVVTPDAVRAAAVTTEAVPVTREPVARSATTTP